MKIKIILVISVIMVCCSEKVQNYNQLLFISDMIVPRNDSMTLSYDELYNGDYKYRVNSDVYNEGEYSKGKNIGLWYYYIQNVKHEFYWAKKTTALPEIISINTPIDWEIVEYYDSVRVLTVDLKQN